MGTQLLRLTSLSHCDERLERRVQIPGGPLGVAIHYRVAHPGRVSRLLDQLRPDLPAHAADAAEQLDPWRERHRAAKRGGGSSLGGTPSIETIPTTRSGRR